MSRFVDAYVTPPAVFVAVIIGGGYGTGREVVEYFSRFGFLPGLLGIALATGLFAFVFARTFNLARREGAYEYRDFFRALIGPAWWLYEVLYITLALLVLGVLGAAAGEMLESEFRVSAEPGLAAVLLCIAGLVFWGRETLERIFAVWTLGMYAVFIAYFLLIFTTLDWAEPTASVDAGGGSWLSGAALYVMYNAAIAPVLLFALRGIRSAREARISGVLTALTLMIPATLLHLSFTLGDARVFEQPVPVYWMLDQHAPGAFRTLFVVALLGTLIQTGAGLVQGFIERLSHAWAPERDEALAPIVRGGVAGAALVLSWGLAQAGVIALVARGYTALAVGFALVYGIPLLTRGWNDSSQVG